MKGILMRDWEMEALLANRKTVTRRVVKPQPEERRVPGEIGCYIYRGIPCGLNGMTNLAPYRPGDILYVRETWTVWNGNYEYKADVDDGYGPFCSSCTLDICTGDCNRALKWHPSIHMPREAARLFLRVTDVRVERLQDITEEQAVKEGFEAIPCNHPGGYPCTDCMNTGYLEPAMLGFVETWDSAIKKADRALYGWESNPWVWVIGFEKISKKEVLAHG